MADTLRLRINVCERCPISVTGNVHVSTTMSCDFSKTEVIDWADLNGLDLCSGSHGVKLHVKRKQDMGCWQKSQNLSHASSF